MSFAKTRCIRHFSAALYRLSWYLNWTTVWCLEKKKKREPMPGQIYCLKFINRKENKFKNLSRKIKNVLIWTLTHFNVELLHIYTKSLIFKYLTYVSFSLTYKLVHYVCFHSSFCLHYTIECSVNEVYFFIKSRNVLAVFF